MKVLFAVGNEQISESIIKKYQQDYKEIISSKNVYYFDAIARELRKDKSYDRIVISEDVEIFTNNNYEVIDKFIFDRLDTISDEATTNDGQDIPIILICADRRVKSEALLVKLFGIGVYSALIGQDRSVSKVCALINKPRTKKEAKLYYRIDTEDVEYKAEDEGDVSEVEIQNILNHYKRLGKNEEKYVESFDNIAAQYTDAQLRVICKFLPLSVKAVLEANSQKYQELITFGTVTPSTSMQQSSKGKKIKSKTKANYQPNSDYHKAKANRKASQSNAKLDVIEKNIGKSNLTQPVIIPSSVNVANVKKAEMPAIKEEVQKPTVVNNAVEDKMKEKVEKVMEKEPNEIDDILNTLSASMNQNDKEQRETEKENSNVAEPAKRKRGRPRKVLSPEEIAAAQAPKKKRGRPRKVQTQEETTLPGVEEQQNETNLFDLADEEDAEPMVTAPEKSTPTGSIVLPGFEEEEEQPYSPPSYQKYQEEAEKQIQPEAIIEEHTDIANYEENAYEQDQDYTKQLQNVNAATGSLDINNLLTRDKKMVAFVGTSKNGTSFLVNNLAEVLSKKGIKTAILDLTQNRNAYYIYTQNEEQLRKTAFSCMTKLRNGQVDGIQVNKNLTVFTSLPGENTEIQDYENILKTLAQNYSLILMDCDFETNYGYFNCAQELYLVQSFDILTIQPLTAFLRDLKTKNILNPEKIRIVLNKVLRVRTVTERTIIGGMAFYNDPAMSFMTELFNKDTVKYCSIPFEEQTYSRYLEGLVNCQITTNGYSKNFMMSLDKLSNMVYPLLNTRQDNSNGRLHSYGTGNGFSSNMNATLNKMKNSY